jgi:hypothetical protein
MRARRAIEAAAQRQRIGPNIARTLVQFIGGRREYARRAASDVDHFWHTWINARQDARRASGEAWESDLYEFKAMLHELRRLPIWFRRERTGELPKVHQRCSFSSPEPIAENRLVCAMGVATIECPILRDLTDKFEARRAERWARFGMSALEDSHLDDLKAKVCCWHIFTAMVREPHSFDTSEGYIQDEGDRRFWSNMYESMAAGDPEPRAEDGWELVNER